MAIGDRTYQFAAHTAWGYPNNLLQNLIEYIGGYTFHRHKTINATAGQILASTAGTGAVQVITTLTNQVDVPRVLAVTIGGSGEGTGSILITGVNVEGKTITDTIAYTTTGQVTGLLVFKRVTSITIPAAMGGSATVTVDTTNRIGLHHRCIPGKTAVVDVYSSNNPGYPDTYPDSLRPILDGNITGSNFDNEFVEKNWVITAQAPNSTYYFYFFYWFTKVLVYPPKDSPEFYSTTTSTSTSSSSTSTSSSSTSTSFSSSSTSTSITTTSTSSTSTSTTTLPV